ncbi:ATP synthase subunit a-1-like [Oryza brachyantha]|uniref:ATP synthase subunit a-1-like n=1 Tax=Oryza brachyantha TaxID=4533 RepID=UPI001ADADB0A|nr:ATP synthase subunit a-1-like [Oryza brachyantha]
MTERSNGSVVNETSAESTRGIYEDHPGLNPADERVVEYQAAIHEKMGKLMIGRNPAEVLAAAERVHGESNDSEFLQEQYQDLVQNGTASEAFQYGVLEPPEDYTLPEVRDHIMGGSPIEDLQIDFFINGYESAFLSEFLPICIYLVISPLVSLIRLGVPFPFASNSSTYPEKLSAYECGSDPSGDARSRFDIRFYPVPILFIIPDLEVTFSFPWAVPPNKIDLFGSWSMMAFLLILTIGFLYEWKRGASDRE